MEDLRAPHERNVELTRIVAALAAPSNHPVSQAVVMFLSAARENSVVFRPSPGDTHDKRSLATSDKLHLDAIDAITRRDFSNAIGSYQKIADQVTGSEQANAYVDLGRAYERSEQLDKAIENYLKAATLDAQSAGAFLHLGVAYSRKRNAEDAEKAFKQAQAIYQVLTNHEGLVEVMFQRGVLFYGAGKLAEAKAEFERVLDMLKSQENNYQLTRTELEPCV